MFDDAENAKIGGITECKDMTTTVFDKLDDIVGPTARFLDILFQQESTNQTAKADVIVGGKAIIENAPATFLLSLEKKLNSMRDMYNTIPTLAPGIS